MKSFLHGARERIALVASNSMRIAGIQGVYGDPCGVEIVPVSVDQALQTAANAVVLVDADSSEPLFGLLEKFRKFRPQARVVVIGLDQDETYIECVIESGAKGFLGANASAEEFMYALHNVREGSIWATRRVLSRLAESQMANRPRDPDKPRAIFTPREQQIIGLLLGGNGNREIGETLGIGPVTVKSHLGRIMRKAGVVNRVELTMYALQRKPSSGRTNKMSEISLVH